MEIHMAATGKIQIQLATESDVKDILNIVKQSFVQYCNAIGIETIEALLETEQDILSDMLHKSIYVAFLNGIPVGSIRIEIKGESAFISRFAILPDYQAMGIGSELLFFVNNMLSPLEVKTIELYSAVENNRLRDFYLMKGFEIISTDNKRGYQRGLFQKILISKAT